jgi:hypothetical protein
VRVQCWRGDGRVDGQVLKHYADGKASAGIVRVVHVIAAVDVIHVDLVCVVPADRPWLNESKPITAVLEARVTADHDGGANAEFVFTAKIGMKAVVWDAAVAPGAQAKSGLRVLPGNVLLSALGRMIRGSLLLMLNVGLRLNLLRVCVLG